MAPSQQTNRRRTAIVTLWSLLLSPGGLVGGPSVTTLTAAPGQATTAAKPAPAPSRQPESPTAPAGPTVDGEWPRRFTTPSGGAFSLFQPQVASWENQKRMTFYAAASYTAKPGDKPALGTIKAEADTKVSVDERLVEFAVLKITESNFPTLDKPQMQEIVAEISKGIPQHDRVIALDRVLASIDKSQVLPKNVEGVKADPPTVFFSKTPAVVVNIDGEPIWSPIAGTDLKYAINTNWDLFEHGTSKTLYLRNDATWLKTTSLDGAWAPAGDLPESFKKLPADDNWTEVKAAVPGKKLAPGAAPKVFVSTVPAELILLRGEPSYSLVDGTSLLWVNNTDSDVFRLGKTGPVFYLVAGRWFTAADFTGPWTFASLKLPADFQKIPLEHDRSRVLASVPGTDQAAEAVLLASIPQTARVEKKAVKAPEVKYDGEPQYQPIEKTTVSRAVNTDKDIIKVGDLYYMCFQGVWFMAKAAAGPWEVTGTVPKEIYRDPGQLAVAQRDLCHRRRQQRRRGHVCDRRRLHGRHGRVGLCRLGLGLLLSTLRLVRRRVSDLSSVLSHLRLQRVVQPVDRQLRPWRGGVWSLWGSGRGRALQPGDGYICARRGRVGSVRWRGGRGSVQRTDGNVCARRRCRRTLWRSWRGGSLQPTHGSLWRDTSGLRRLRQLGPDGCAARRRLGDDGTRHQSRHGNDDARDAGEWRRLDGEPQHTWSWRVVRRAERQR